MTVDGRLYDSTTPEDPLLDNSVLMKIQILNPTKTCILYEEEQTVSTLSSNGYFNVRVGSPTSGPESSKRTTSTIDVGNSMMEIFQNQNASIAGRTSGGAGCGYSPAAGDTRYFRFVVTPSTTGVTSTLSPDMQIDSVPQSLVAETLQGMTPGNFVQTNTDVTQAKVNTLFGASYTTLSGLLSGSSSLYLQNTTNGTVIPSRATSPVAPTAGQIWYDSDDFVLRYYDGTTVLTLGTSGGDPTKLPLAGGTMAGAINMAGNDITDLGHVTQAPQRTFRFGVYTTAQQATLIATPLVAGHEGTVWYNTTTNKLMFWDGTAEFAVSPVDSVFGRTGAVVAVAGDYTASQVTNVASGAVTAVTVQSAINELDTEKVAKAGDTMTGALNLDNEQELRLSEADGSGANFVAIKALATLGANYTLTLPHDDGNSGQYLQTDGNGILTWVTPAGVGETNTGSNQGAAGVGVYDAKSGVDLQFRNINAASNKINVALDAGNKEIDINVNEVNLNSAVIPNTAAGTIAATNVQAAINELDTEKVATTRAINTVAGSGLTGGGDLSADRSLSVNINGTTGETAVAGVDEILIYDVSATALRKMTRTNFVLSETEVDAMVSNNGFLTTEADTLATVTSRGANTATSITLNTQAQARFADSAGGEYAAIQAPATIGSNYILTLPTDDGIANQVLTTDGSGVLSWTSLAAVGESNTASNQGAAGVGLYDLKAGVDLQFRNINAASNKVSIALDAGNKEVDINVNEANLALGSIPNTVAGTIAATNAQAAINELDSEKVAKAGDTITGALNIDNEQELRLSEADGSGANYVAIKALTTLGANYTLTLPSNDGDSGQYLQTDGNGVLAWVTPAGAGETNTASNQGAGGIGVFKQKTTFDLEFRNINAASNKISIALDAANNEIDINVGEANLDLGIIPNTPAGTVAATTAQTAINELDTDKVAKIGDSMSGALTFTAQNQARFADSAGGEYVAIQAPATIGTNYVLTLPDTAGSASQVLTTNGSGVLSWTTPSTTPAANSLDFTHFTNAMTLDASTDIAASGTNVLSITNSGTDNSFRVNDQTSDATPFVIDASGSVGIGTTAPEFQVHSVLPISAALPNFVAELQGNTAANASAFVGRRARDSAGTPAAIQSGDSIVVFGGRGYHSGGWSGGSSGALVIVAEENFTPTNRGTSLRFTNTPNASTVNATRMTIQQDGSVGIGTTVPGTLLDVAGAITSRPFGTATGQTGQLIVRELAAGGTDTVAIRAPDSITASYVLTLPVDAGSSGQLLQTNGSGVLSWVGAPITGGTFLAGAGSNTAPSISFAADTNTGIYNPYDGALRITSNDTNLFTIDLNGIYSTTGIYIRPSGPTSEAFPPYTFVGDEDTGIFRPAANILGFSTNSTEKMRIDANGFVGIGTTNPGTILDAAGAITSRPSGTGTGQTGQLSLRELAAGGSETATIRAPDAIATSFSLTLPNTAGSSGQLLQTDGSGALAWANSESSITLDSLDFTHLADNLTLDANTDIAVTGANAFSVTNSGTASSFRVNDAASDTTPFVIDPAGQVGIGTSTPSKALDVAGEIVSAAQISANNTASSAGVEIGLALHNRNSSTSGPTSAIEFNTAAAVGRSQIRSGPEGSSSTGFMSFITRDSGAMVEKVRITSVGNVGIGTTTPGTNTKLDVIGQIRSPSSSISTGSVDFLGGNTVTTSFDCGSNITFANLRQGGSYTLIVTGTGTAQCNFSTTTTGDDAATVTYRFQPANGTRVSSSHSIYSLLRVGSIVYVSWITGFI